MPFDLTQKRKQQMGRRDAGIMGQGIGRGLQMLQNQQRPQELGMQYREDLARAQEARQRDWNTQMQAQGNYPPVLNQPQQNAGFNLGEMQNYMNQFGQGSQLPAQQPAAPQQAQVMAERMRQMRQPYNQSVMPDIYRQRAMEQQRQKMMQQPRGAGAAGIMRKLMLERARKRYAQEQMQQRQRFNPFLNR